jgi:cell division protein FtsB
MENQYYRKPRPKIKNWVNQTLRKKHIVITLLIVVPVFSFMLFSNKGVLQRVSLESQKKEMQAKVREAQQEQVRLQQQSKALDADPKAIEKVAREKYGMIREGETVYKVKKEQR